MVAVGILLAAACGDGGDDEGLSAQEYRAQANVICDEGNERTDELSEQLLTELNQSDELPSDDRLRELLEPLLDDIDQQIDDVRALSGPEDLEADVHASLDDAEKVVGELRNQLADDPSAIFESEDDPFAEVNEQLTALGLDECGA